MRNISRQVLALNKAVEETKAHVNVVDEKAREADEKAEDAIEAVENVDKEETISMTEPPPNTSFPDVDEVELAVMLSLWSKPLTRRTLGNIAKEAKLQKAKAAEVLKVLENKGLVEQLSHSRTNQPVYRRTPVGKALSILRLGQEPSGLSPAPTIPP
jgi:ribosomal protein S25